MATHPITIRLPDGMVEARATHPDLPGYEIAAAVQLTLPGALPALASAAAESMARDAVQRALDMIDRQGVEAYKAAVA